GVGEAPAGPAFDELITHIDGYLCELKDAQIRGGLHILGQPPSGAEKLDLLAAITRLPYAGGPSLRSAVAERLGLDISDRPSIAAVDAVEAECRALLDGHQAPRTHAETEVLRWVESTLGPALDRTGDEIGSILDALDGRWIPPGPSGAPTRGMAHVLSTGRNFYSVDPKALPSQLAWEVGQKLASELVARYAEEHGAF